MWLDVKTFVHLRGQLPESLPGGCSRPGLDISYYPDPDGFAELVVDLANDENDRLALVDIHPTERSCWEAGDRSSWDLVEVDLHSAQAERNPGRETVVRGGSRVEVDLAD